MNKIPTMIRKEKFWELAEQESDLNLYYERKDSNFYKCCPITKEEKQKVEICLDRVGFSALNFTDSRAVFQFYNLSHLWEHILIALNNNLTVLNLATEPISVDELYYHLTNDKFVNEINPCPPKYDFRTKYDYLFNGKHGYIYDKNTVLQEIVEFIEDNR